MAVSWLFLMLHTTPWALKPSPHSFSLFSLSLTALSFSLSITYPSIRKPYPLSLNLRRALKHSTLSLSLSLSHSVPLFAFSPSSVPFRFRISPFSRIPTIPNSTAMGDGKVNLPDDLFSGKLSDSLRGDLIWFDSFQFRLGLFFFESLSLETHVFIFSQSLLDLPVWIRRISIRDSFSVSIVRPTEEPVHACVALDSFVCFCFCFCFYFLYVFVSAFFVFNFGLSWLWIGDWSVLASLLI